MSAKPVAEPEIKVPVKQRAASFSPPLKYRIVSDEEINLTKARAFQFLELKTFEGERPVRERHVQFLFDEWSANRFLWQNIILASAKLGDKEYRINGQHTCWMRVNVPERYEPLDCKIRAMTYAVNDDEQLRTLYSVFDRGAPRTQAHVGKVLLMGSEATEGVPHSVLGTMLAGFKLHWSPDKNKRESMSVNDWAGLIDNNYAQLFNLVARWFAGHYDASRFLRRSSVVGAMFFTFQKSVQASDEFWGRVYDGINLQAKTDARWQLREYLQSHGHSIIGGMEKVSQEQMLCTALNLWNHWRSGTPVRFVKTVNERPKVKA
jgi:hypothetical protein